jgi:hypothetical protein
MSYIELFAWTKPQPKYLLFVHDGEHFWNWNRQAKYLGLLIKPEKNLFWLARPDPNSPLPTTCKTFRGIVS